MSQRGCSKMKRSMMVALLIAPILAFAQDDFESILKKYRDRNKDFYESLPPDKRKEWRDRDFNLAAMEYNNLQAEKKRLAQEQAVEKGRSKFDMEYINSTEYKDLQAQRARLVQERVAEWARLEQEQAAEKARLEQELAAEKARLEQELAAEKRRLLWIGFWSLVVSLLFLLLPGIFIGRRKERMGDCVALCLLLGPVGIVIACFLQAGGASCPFCKSRMMKSAKVCPRCTRDIPGKSIPQHRPSAQVNGVVVCSFCGHAMKVAVNSSGDFACPNCKQTLLV